MNDDDFLHEQREAPRHEFVTDLYKRINKPMVKKPVIQQQLWQPALAFGALVFLFAATLLLSPAARTFAGTQLNQIGAILLRAADGSSELEPRPTTPAPSGPIGQAVSDAGQASIQAGFTAFAPSYVPTGYRATEWTVQHQESGVYVVTNYRAENGRNFLIMNQTQFTEGAFFEQEYGKNETVTEISIGSTTGVSIEGRLMTHPDQTTPPSGSPDLMATNWLIWESNGITYTLFSNDLDQSELLRIATSLTE